MRQENSLVKPDSADITASISRVSKKHRVRKTEIIEGRGVRTALVTRYYHCNDGLGL